MTLDDAHHFLFLIEGIGDGFPDLELTGEENHHLTRVLRKQAGDEVFVTDGRGRIIRCRILETGQHYSRLETIDLAPVKARRRPVSLALACIRKERFERAVAQCTELGIGRFIPFLAAKSQQKAYQDNFIKRMNRIMQTAMKQSFQAFMPKLEATASFDDLIGQIPSHGLTVVGDPDAPVFRPVSGTDPILLIIGPEGGFTGPERTRLDEAGATFASSSATRLRSETAAVSMASLILSLVD